MRRATPISRAVLVRLAAPTPNSTAVRSGLMRAMLAMISGRATKTACISTRYRPHGLWPSGSVTDPMFFCSTVFGTLAVLMVTGLSLYADGKLRRQRLEAGNHE